MPQPNNRYDLLRQKKNNFKRQSFYVQANSVAPPVIPPAPLLPVFGVPADLPIPDYDISFEDNINTFPQQPTSFTLTSNTMSITEGGSVDITLTTTGIPDNSLIAFTIDNTQPGDINVEAANVTSTTTPFYHRILGDFTINNNTSTITLNTSTDNIIEDDQIISLYLNNGMSTIDIVINDDPSLADDILGTENLNEISTETLSSLSIQ